MVIKKPKYDFYEKVIICAPRKRIDGALGAILGRAQNEEGKWSYAVHLYGYPTCWSVSEEELLPTGEFDVRETFYDGSTLRVRVDSEGRGSIVGMNEPGEDSTV